VFVIKLDSINTSFKLRHGWEDNIKMYLKLKGYWTYIGFTEDGDGIFRNIG
jgi:hypothetical protein